MEALSLILLNGLSLSSLVSTSQVNEKNIIAASKFHTNFDLKQKQNRKKDSNPHPITYYQDNQGC